MPVLRSVANWGGHVLLERECNLLREHFIFFYHLCFDDMSSWYADLFLLYYRLRVVPLFETVKDLREAGSVIRKLLSIEWYREHIQKNHTGHQEVDILNSNHFHIWRMRQLCVLKDLQHHLCAGDGWIF